MTNRELIARRQRLLGAAPLFYSEPIHIVRGEGVYLFDDSGRRYVDMYNNVPCVGHAHPHVVAAMHKQAATLNVHSRYLHEGVLDYAERLLELHHQSLDQMVFACTGTEANEVAIAMARAASGGRGLICTDATYHGNSAEVSKLTRTASFRNQAPRHPDIRSIPFPQMYRPIAEGESEENLCDRYIAEVHAAIGSLAAAGVPFAGMIVCPILANEGLPDIPQDFMRRAAKLVRASGGLLIADEVQAGFCRTGSWWGYEAEDFVPDIVTMGKPMGSGMPLAGVAARADLVGAFRKANYYFNTFAASPLQAAVGSAVIDVIEGEQLGERVSSVGAYLKAGLLERAAACDHIGDVRGIGLFIGLEWVKSKETREPAREEVVACVDALKERGFLTSNAGALRNVLKIRPPLVFEQHHADSFLEAFDDMLEERYGAA